LWCYSECISTPGELEKYARPRLKALAEAAAARESDEYERVMTRKEHDCRKRELEHAKEMAILIVDKKVAIANAKLKAIEEALQEEELGEKG
jgi:guanylate kinase